MPPSAPKVNVEHKHGRTSYIEGLFEDQCHIAAIMEITMYIIAPGLSESMQLFGYSQPHLAETWN